MAIGLSFLPKNALNLNGSTGGHLDVSLGSIMLPEDQYAVRPGLEVENEIDEMFRVVEMKFQPRDGSPDPDVFLMVLPRVLKKVLNGDDFNKSFGFNGLHKAWREGIASGQFA